MAFDPQSVISADRIIDLQSTNKQGVLQELIAVLASSRLVHDTAELTEKIIEREKTASTGVGHGIAIPHAKIASIDDFVAAIGRSRDGIDFDSLDGQPTHIVVMIGCNNKQSGDYLKVLARLVKRLPDPNIQKAILEAETMEHIRDIFLTGDGVFVG